MGFKPKNWNQRQGSHGEKLAAAFLKKRGYRILEQRYRCFAGEVDLIALRDQTLAFAEVKYRRNLEFGDPLEAVTFNKLRHFRRTCEHYLQRKPEFRDLEIECFAIGIRDFEGKVEIDCRKLSEF